MGTEISLKLGPVTLDWSKNSRGGDHGVLYQEVDRTRITSGYEDADCAGAQSTELALVRPLKSTVPRIELLGFTLAAVQAEYEARAHEWLSMQIEDAYGEIENSTVLSFSEFVDFLARHPINALNTTYVKDYTSRDFAELNKRFLLDPAFNSIPDSLLMDGYSETDCFGSLIRIIHPYAVLRLLAEVPENLDLELCWHYGPMVESGWAKEEEFTAGARRHQKFLVATEGTSDIHILSYAIFLLMSGVADFFTFMDVSERHPFSGTGSLVKFAEGLVKIDVHNPILFLFDNDAEGWAALEELDKYKLPSNMRATGLPELEEFRQFDAYGPQGVVAGDINKRAAAIECYLDLHLKDKPTARVIWTNYKEKRKEYQGSLEFKDSYTKAFLEQTPQSVASGAYDVSKLRKVLEHIFGECAEIAAAQLKTVN